MSGVHPPRLGPLAREIAASPRTTAALATTGIGLAFFAPPFRELAGTPALVGALLTLLVLLGVSLTVRRREIEWNGLLPVSLLAYLAWAALSIFWAESQWATLGSLAQLGAFTAVGVFTALSRDTIQIVRIVADVLRVWLAVGMFLEILTGILLDTPFPALDIAGLLAEGGPITGLAQTPDGLALVAEIAAITFIIEWRSRISSRGVALGSLSLAVASFAFAGSGIALVSAVLVALGALALWVVRRAPASARPAANIAVLAGAALVLVVAWLARVPLLRALGATREVDSRIRLWSEVGDVAARNVLEGVGWVGQWPTGFPPYSALLGAASGSNSAQNAYLDLVLQLGAVGVVLFCGLTGLAFVRSWLLAAGRRSIGFAWPALVLVALVTSSIASSAVLVDAGWTVLVVGVVKASGELSWRQALRPEPAASDLPRA